MADVSWTSLAALFAAACIFPIILKLIAEDHDGRRAWLRSLCPVAQRTERHGPNVGVAGSNPAGTSNAVVPGVNCFTASDVAAAPRELKPCANCKQRPGTIVWIGTSDGLTYARNPTGWPMWCTRCSVEARLAHARELAATIPELERELAKLP